MMDVAESIEIVDRVSTSILVMLFVVELKYLPGIVR